MSDAANTSELEKARSRLEAALSALTQGVASTRDMYDLVTDSAAAKAASDERIATLEQENLKLHEQIAALALGNNDTETDRQKKNENERLKTLISEMESDKAAIREELDKTIGELERMLEDA